MIKSEPIYKIQSTGKRDSVLLAQQAIVSREGRKVHPRERRPSRAPRGERGGMTLEKGGESCFHSETDRLVASKPEASPVSRRGPLYLQPTTIPGTTLVRIEYRAVCN